MRFKSIFWLFNIVVILALILISAASFLILEANSATLFWRNMWLLLLMFVIMIAALDFYFILNWKLFTYLEGEDWPSLLAWLEDRLYNKGKINRPYSNLLINTALSVSNLDAVKKLETEIRQRKPKLIKSLGVSLGIPVLLEQDWGAIGDYFGPLADNPGTRGREWARWCRALASGKDGIGELVELSGENDISIQLLSIQVLEQMRDNLTEIQFAELSGKKTETKTAVKGSAGERLLQRSRENHLMAVVLSSRVNEIIKELMVVPG